MQNKRVICHIVLLYVCAKGIDFALCPCVHNFTIRIGDISDSVVSFLIFHFIYSCQWIVVQSLYRLHFFITLSHHLQR